MKKKKPRGGAQLSLVSNDVASDVASDDASDDASIDISETALALALLRAEFVEDGAPAEVLRVIDASTNVDDALARLVEAGLMPTQEESLAEMVNGWAPTLEPGCDQLSAELCGSELLGEIQEASPDDAALHELLTVLIEQVRDYGTAEALAMLRVLAVLAPPPVRPVAGAAADTLAAAGRPEPPWVAGLGAPTVGPSFGYADALGEQESITVSFSYGRKRHALVVLIDHGLGGGVKDCFPTDRPGEIRTRYQRAARQFGLEFRDYQPAEAAAILRRALARLRCPVEPDQIEDVGSYLGLLRARAELLGETPSPVSGPAQPPAGTRTRAARTGNHVHRLKIALRGAKPSIWRRLEVPSDITLEQLHLAIQQAFGWEDCHLWVFSTPAGEYGQANAELGHHSAAWKKLSDVAPRPGRRIRYTYDFGDDWEHEITVEDVRPAEPGVAYPRCSAGRRAGPPEDCGGIWGYDYLLEVLADPGHQDHAERMDWLSLDSAAQFDPAAFDVAEVNAALSRLARVLVPR